MVIVILVVLVLEEETRHWHWKTYSPAPGRGLLGYVAQSAREGKEMAIMRQTQ